MVRVLDGAILGTAGVGKFHRDISPAGRAALTTLNVIGWTPGLSIFSGAIRTVAGIVMMQKRASSKRNLGKVWIARGLSEIFCVGMLHAPIDITASTVRSITKARRRLGAC
jgi:hypothetical protein